MEIPALSEYTPIPFWFWNDELSEEEILRQMKEMKDKGVDGFVIHPRKGLPSSIAFFTYEPNILGRNAREDVIPWSDGLYEEFVAAGGSEKDLKFLFNSAL